MRKGEIVGKRVVIDVKGGVIGFKKYQAEGEIFGESQLVINDVK